MPDEHHCGLRRSYVGSRQLRRGQLPVVHTTPALRFETVVATRDQAGSCGKRNGCAASSKHGDTATPGHTGSGLSPKLAGCTLHACGSSLRILTAIFLWRGRSCGPLFPCRLTNPLRKKKRRNINIHPNSVPPFFRRGPLKQNANFEFRPQTDKPLLETHEVVIAQNSIRNACNVVDNQTAIRKCTYEYTSSKGLVGLMCS